MARTKKHLDTKQSAQKKAQRPNHLPPPLPPAKHHRPTPPNKTLSRLKNPFASHSQGRKAPERKPLYSHAGKAHAEAGRQKGLDLKARLLGTHVGPLQKDPSFGQHSENGTPFRGKPSKKNPEKERGKKEPLPLFLSPQPLKHTVKAARGEKAKSATALNVLFSPSVVLAIGSLSALGFFVFLSWQTVGLQQQQQRFLRHLEHTTYSRLSQEAQFQKQRRTELLAMLYETKDNPAFDPTQASCPKHCSKEEAPLCLKHFDPAEDECSDNPRKIPVFTKRTRSEALAEFVSRESLAPQTSQGSVAAWVLGSGSFLGFRNRAPRINLREAALAHIWANGINLEGGNLSFANLFSADLLGSNLTEANLYQTNLAHAGLSQAKLRKSNLIRATLRGADLYGADLSGASLYGADLRGADLRNTDLRNADLEGILYDEKTQVEGAKFAGAKQFPLLWQTRAQAQQESMP